MEKKGELLNQLAVVSDTVEKINADIKSRTLIFEVSQVEFDKIFEMVEKKYGKKSDKPKNSFSITIGVMDIIFNTNSV
jgi:hypothetical protein